MDRKILIVTGDGGESYETLYAVHRFQEEGDIAVIAARRQSPRIPAQLCQASGSSPRV